MVEVEVEEEEENENQDDPAEVEVEELDVCVVAGVKQVVCDVCRQQCHVSNKTRGLLGR